MHEVIASLDGYFCSPERNFDWKRGGVSRIPPAGVRVYSETIRGVPQKSHLLVTDNPSRVPREFADDTTATTVTQTRAVSSVVERLVYTERVGGSNPSPPILLFSISELRLESLAVASHPLQGIWD